MKISMHKSTLLLFAVMLVFSGCASTGVNEQNRALARRELELDNIRADLKRIESKLEGMEKAQQYIDGRLAQMENTSLVNAEKLKAELAQLRSQVTVLEETRGKLRQEIISDISSRISNLMKTHSASSGSSGNTGYEHIVQTGETLSIIAQAYKVKVSDIVKANKIEDPNNVRAGTKLFIPQ